MKKMRAEANSQLAIYLLPRRFWCCAADCLLRRACFIWAEGDYLITLVHDPGLVEHIDPGIARFQIAFAARRFNIIIIETTHLSSPFGFDPILLFILRNKEQEECVLFKIAPWLSSIYSSITEPKRIVLVCSA